MHKIWPSASNDQLQLSPWHAACTWLFYATAEDLKRGLRFHLEVTIDTRLPLDGSWMKHITCTRNHPTPLPFTTVQTGLYQLLQTEGSICCASPSSLD